MRTLVGTLMALVSFCTQNVGATDRVSPDVVALSPIGRFRVLAESPNNRHQRNLRMNQSSFVYRFIETRTGKTRWIRQQPMGGTPSIATGSSKRNPLEKEGSPRSLFVSDSGWTVIRTSWDELIAVDFNGKDRCHIELLSEAFTEDENARFVRQTTGGLKWSWCSLWYFLDVGHQSVFVVRPWWGRRIFVDLTTGNLVSQPEVLLNAGLGKEREIVLDDLEKGVESYKTARNKAGFKPPNSLLASVYVAGQLKLSKATQLLRQLEEVGYSDCSISGIMHMPDGKVDPFSYSTLTFRQVVQLSLRRLGVAPKPLPVYIFDVRFHDYTKNHDYHPRGLAHARGYGVESIKDEMEAEQVLALIGTPDFVDGNNWEYDIDSNHPFSVIVTWNWDTGQVTSVEKRDPPIWRDGFVRDLAMARRESE